MDSCVPGHTCTRLLLNIVWGILDDHLQNIGLRKIYLILDSCVPGHTCTRLLLKTGWGILDDHLQNIEPRKMFDFGQLSTPVNSLYTNGLFLLDCNNALGIVHCTYLGVAGYNLTKHCSLLS